MVLYTVRAVSPKGEVITRREEAQSEDDLERRLEASGLTLARVMRAEQRTGVRSQGTRLDRGTLADVTERLQILYASGIPLVEALAEIEESASSEGLRSIAVEMRTAVERGQPLSEAMARFPAAFPATYLSAIRAAEKSGALDEVLARLAAQLEWERGALGTIRQALIYPAILCVAVLTLLSFLFTYLLPKIAVFFRDAKAELPMPTRVVLGISDLLTQHGMTMLGGFVCVAVGIAAARRTAGGRAVVDRFLLSVPVLGNLLRKLACARFVATLRMLHESGTPMMEALASSKDAAGNAALARELGVAVDRISDGSTLTDALADVRSFDPLVTRMIRVGESSGSLSEALGHATRMLDRDVQRRTKSLLAFLEPMLLVFSGVVVGFVVFATLLPIFRMLGNLR